MISQAAIDIAGALLCGLTSLAFFTIHVFSSPKRPNWIALPEHLRWGTAVSGTLFMIRSVSLTPADTPFAGQHLPPLGLLTTLALAWTIGALAFYLVAQHFPAGVWDRFAFAVKRTHEDPDLVPLVLEPADVAQVAEAKGIVLLKPAEDVK